VKSPAVTLKRVLERDYTELFIQFTIDGLIRVSGWLKHLNSSNQEKRKKAESYCETLKLVLGDDRIDEFCKEWFRWRDGEKEERALKYYIAGLCDYFPHVECVGIPIGSSRPVYYLLYTTRNDTGKKIMHGIIEKARRKGKARLEKWF
jgi:hypothetical protein